MSVIPNATTASEGVASRTTPDLCSTPDWRIRENLPETSSP
jgi:hypothetical protein